MKIGVTQEQHDENRVALTPSLVAKYQPHEVFIEAGCGIRAGFPDSSYENSIILSRNDLLSHVDIVVTVKGLNDEDLPLLKKDTVIVGLLRPDFNKAHLVACANFGLTTLSLEFLPRITRAQSMDVLSSQANLAGYRSIIEASAVSRKVFPLMMTAAGTIPAARVLVLGAGVSGLQAIATAKRLGAIVSSFDVRESVKEQIESLGATFVSIKDACLQKDQEYAKESSKDTEKAIEDALNAVIEKQDIVITTALIPGKKAPILVTQSMMQKMKEGSVILDLSGEFGGNCEGGVLGATIVYQGVTLITPKNILNSVAHDASLLYAKNIYAFVSLILNGDFEDELLKATLMTYQGQLKFS